jgi:HSP20 family protein
MSLKRKSFLDLLTKNPKEEVLEPVAQETTIPFTQELPEITEEPNLEEKSWLAEAGEDGQLTLDVYQTDKEIIIKSTIAGVKPEDLDISFSNGMIVIKGERKMEEKVSDSNYFYQELYWGSFSRSVILPTEVDQDAIDAELKNGILTVILPKKEASNQRKIKVKSV